MVGRWLQKRGINDITVVGGYRAENIDNAGIRLVVNQNYATTGELVSLTCAIDKINSEVTICYGDLLFRHYVLRDLLENTAEFCVVVDSSQTSADNRTVRNFVYCTEKDNRGMPGQKVLLKHVTNDLNAVPYEDPLVQGRWIGLLNVSGKGLNRLKIVLTNLRMQPEFNTFGMPELLNALIADGAAIEVLYIHGHWRSVNDLNDFTNAQTPLKNTENLSYKPEIDQ
ncbi:glycosyltransferase family protein [Candidatus Williamhamiltonella defendens]|uniref:hypothetical protein n=1 Tax=Candidatus Williamhamiltonella defendens TaxID=138072 RepID=UPI001F40A796|nr:hypothetical protein [Candidatus Hamiltonella defensa]